jgi:hypothetical protein
MFILPIAQLLLLLCSSSTSISTSPVLLDQACPKSKKAATPGCWLHVVSTRPRGSQTSQLLLC